MAFQGGRMLYESGLCSHVLPFYLYFFMWQSSEVKLLFTCVYNRIIYKTSAWEQ